MYVKVFVIVTSLLVTPSSFTLALTSYCTLFYYAILCAFLVLTFHTGGFPVYTIVFGEILSLTLSLSLFSFLYFSIRREDEF